MRLNLPKVSLSGFLFLLWHCILGRRCVNHSAEGGLPSTGWEVVFTCKLYIFSELPFLSKCHILLPLIVSFIDYFFLKIEILHREVRFLAPVTCGSLARFLSTLLQIWLRRVEGTGRVGKQNSSPFSILSPSWWRSRHLQILSIHTRKRPTALGSGRLLLCEEMLFVAPWRLSPSLLDTYFPMCPWDSIRVASLNSCWDPTAFWIQRWAPPSFLEPGSSSSGREKHGAPACKAESVLAALLP